MKENQVPVTGALLDTLFVPKVSWFLMKEPIEVSTKQSARFRTIFNNIARPVQPLHSRTPLLKIAGNDAHSGGSKHLGSSPN